jgi:hypothetical protein
MVRVAVLGNELVLTDEFMATFPLSEPDELLMVNQG